jgi:hypothetical protein
MGLGGDVMEMVWISKRRIAAKKTETITAIPDVTVALWLEQGSIEVLSELDGEVVAKIESEGCVPLRDRAVHLRNTGRTPAIVFVAMGSALPAAAPPPRAVALPKPHAAPPPRAAALPKPHAAPPPRAAAPPRRAVAFSRSAAAFPQSAAAPKPQLLEMAERRFQQPAFADRSPVKKFNVFCTTNSHGLLNDTPLSNAKAVALQDEHLAENTDCADCTRIRPA